MSAFPNPGIYANVPETEYHKVGFRDGVLSKSELWRFWQSPFKWKFGPEKETTAAMRWGSLVDAFLFQSKLERAASVAISPYSDFRTKEARQWRDMMIANGVEVASKADADAAELAAATANHNKVAGQILRESDFQLSVIAGLTNDRTRNEILLKSRIDIAPGKASQYSDWLFDFKTINDLGKIENAIADYGYHGQAGLYLDLWNLASGENRKRFGFIFLESSEPYEVAVVELEKADIEAGRYWYQDALSLWAKCLDENHFPGRYDDSEIETVSRPMWAEEKELNWSL